MNDKRIQTVCPHCLTKNRLPENRLSESPKCGKCGEPLLNAKPVALDDQSLPRFLASEELPVIIDFWAEWCGPCKMMAPLFAEAAGQRPQWRFVKVDTERAQQAAQQFQIRSIPTIALLRGGRELARQSGAMPAQQLLQWVDQHL